MNLESLSARNQLERVGDVDKSLVSLIVGFDRRGKSLWSKEHIHFLTDTGYNQSCDEDVNRQPAGNILYI